jgi:hypothetical protein
VPSARAFCDKAKPESAPASRFEIHKTTVYDKKTNLTWARCAVGQAVGKADPLGSGLNDFLNIGDDTCRGIPQRYGWRDAQQVLADYAGWRLPTNQELSTIVEHRCDHPAINQTVFPGNVIWRYNGNDFGSYWASDSLSNTGGSNPITAFILTDFVEGKRAVWVTGTWAVRLVRDGR